MGKKNRERANSLQEKTPKPNIDRIIRERYPTFVDALGELNDCLTMVHLFAALPALKSKKIDVELVHKCRRLAHEWQTFVSRTHKLRKTFVSFKGVYYQAEVEGQTITWLTPHLQQQVVSDDVDIPTVLNFLQLYEPLLGFVNFNLYRSINLKYPPILDPQLEALAADIYALYADAFRPSGPISEASKLAESEQVESKKKGADAENEKSEEDQDTRECKNLFKNLKFFLSSEVRPFG
ncbi:pescadillo-like protein [Trifolium medium]|uniref:Pescadillo-like protein n=1 Tax=Trifolium medium TaxID=97028 RepID=A0A392M3S8_9FABA|nr:pescadillo-like protein [Trifolium medium]